LPLGYHSQDRKPLKTLTLRLNGIQEVSGSIPLISTKEKAVNPLFSRVCGFFLFSAKNSEKQ